MDIKKRQSQVRIREIKWAAGGVIAGVIAGFAVGFLVCFLVTSTLPPRPAEPPAPAQATSAPVAPSFTPVPGTN